MNKVLIRSISAFLGAVVVPFLLAWVYLYLSRTKGSFAASSDEIALAICLINGLGAIAISPISKAARIFISIIYIPTALLMLTLFALMYVCGNFGACL